jgi:predicted lipid-binding transport protein (Tim44 family)
MNRFSKSFALIAALFVGFTLVSTDYADARRGGSFGSRGTRTWSAPAPTRTAPKQTAPVERSMTPNQPGTSQATRQTAPNAAQQRPGLFGSPLMNGILLGGLFGMLLGTGFGGAAGALGFILQLLLLGFLASMFMGWLRSRNQTAAAGGSQRSGTNGFGRDMLARDNGQAVQGRAGGFNVPPMGGAQAQPAQTEDISVAQDDLDTFERRLGDVQRAFADEDHAALRRLSTPEMVSYFSEELADNAKRGLRNDVSDVRLVQADIAEAWREGDTDYATAAFEYESIDVMRDRNTDQIVSGDEHPTSTVELWTFVRRPGEEWKLSAIQEA